LAHGLYNSLYYRTSRDIYIYIRKNNFICWFLHILGSMLCYLWQFLMVNFSGSQWHVFPMS